MDLFKAAQAFPPSLRGAAKILTAAQIAEAGLSPDRVRWLAQRGRLVRALHGTYLVGASEPDLLDRGRAAMLVCPAGSVIGFQTAAALEGFGVVSDGDAVHVVAPAGSTVTNRRGLRIHQSTLPVDEPVLVRGVACTPVARTAIDLARVLDRGLAQAVLDAALAAGACSAAMLSAEVRRHDGLPGVRQARELVARADGRSECVQESLLRLVIHDAGLLGFEPQVEVFDDSGYARYRLDLADRTHRIVAEYDGASHVGDRAGLRRDRARHNWLDEHGWRMRYFTDQQLYHRPHEIVRTLRRAIDSSPTLGKSG